MIERAREAAVWERVRAASSCCPEPAVRQEAPPAVHSNRPTCRAGLSVCGDLPLLVGVIILLSMRRSNP